MRDQISDAAYATSRHDCHTRVKARGGSAKLGTIYQVLKDEQEFLLQKVQWQPMDVGFWMVHVIEPRLCSGESRDETEKEDRKRKNRGHGRF
jgi:hypothetical protein